MVKSEDMPPMLFLGEGDKKDTILARNNDSHLNMSVECEQLQCVRVKEEPIEDISFSEEQDCSRVEQPLLKCKNEAEWNCGTPDVPEDDGKDTGAAASVTRAEGRLQRAGKSRAHNKKWVSAVGDRKSVTRARSIPADKEASALARCSKPTEGTMSLLKLKHPFRCEQDGLNDTSTAVVTQHPPASARLEGSDTAATEKSSGVGSRGGEKSHSCHLCSATLTTPHGLKGHLNRHKGFKPYKCGECSYSSAAKQALESHIRHRHSGERPFKCDLCGMAYASPSILTVHRRTHTGEKPYPCCLCPMTFAACSARRKHVLSIHSTVKPYTCEYCGKTFPLLDYLKRHERVHTGDTPHLCHLCPSRFTRRSSLAVHVRNHMNDRPFQCKQCEKCFVSASRLAEHVQSMHSSEPAFPCKLCPRKYKHKCSLNAHLRDCHPAEMKT